MSDIINTDSFLFKMYTAARIRQEKRYWSKQDVIHGDKDTINICTYGRNILKEAFVRLCVNFVKLLAGVTIGLMILVPVMSVLLWMFTDNEWMFFMGSFGEFIMQLDSIVVAVVVVLLLMFLLSEAIAAWRKVNIPVPRIGPMTTLTTVGSWISAKKGKYCTKLQFDSEVEQTETKNV